MHYAWAIAREGLDPADAPKKVAPKTRRKSQSNGFTSMPRESRTKKHPKRGPKKWFPDNLTMA